jgi:hypothetical protein
MKEIMLTQGKVALVDDSDFEWLSQWKWHTRKSPNTYYAVRNSSTGGKRGIRTGRGNRKSHTIQMHRLILNVSTGMETDHRDMNGLNNQRSNLRVCTKQQNNQNRKTYKKSSSIYKGVCWWKRDKRWGVSIRFNGKRQHLGYFDSETKAAKAYDKAALKHFGEFARLNFS